MDTPNENSDNNDCYLRHEAHMWALDCLAEQELRAQQIREDFGLEVNLEMLVDTDNAWFKLEDGVGSTPPDRNPLLSTNKFYTSQHLVTSPDHCMRLDVDAPRMSSSDHHPSGLIRTSSDRILNVGHHDTSTTESSPRSRESTPEPAPSSSPYNPTRITQGEKFCTGRLAASSTVSSPASSRESAPEYFTPVRTRQNARYRASSPAHQKMKPENKSSQTSPRLPTRAHFSSSSHILPSGASWDAYGKVCCGLNGCTRKYQSAADLRRHRESLVHCRFKQHACPGCPLRFTREDAVKRHLNNWGSGRCRNQEMTTLRDEFLRTKEARDAQREGHPDRVLIALYDIFLGETNAGSSKRRRGKW
ncbi:hypothetical protein B0H12DRAFT_1275786 [Mycena haematopus]|nr:hypothetical protein B0H12DRAFT_1275786 [Mycena haematopus]